MNLTCARILEKSSSPAQRRAIALVAILTTGYNRAVIANRQIHTISLNPTSTVFNICKYDENACRSHEISRQSTSSIPVKRLKNILQAFAKIACV